MRCSQIGPSSAAIAAITSGVNPVILWTPTIASRAEVPIPALTVTTECATEPESAMQVGCGGVPMGHRDRPEYRWSGAIVI
jgi:hypothetical protein